MFCWIGECKQAHAIDAPVVDGLRSISMTCGKPVAILRDYVTMAVPLDCELGDLAGEVGTAAPKSHSLSACLFIHTVSVLNDGSSSDAI